jgi:hypothetical protein
MAMGTMVTAMGTITISTTRIESLTLFF